jgi:hypothetical protein
MINTPSNFKTYAPVKIPKVLKLIRKKEIIRDSWWTPEYGGDKYYSSIFHDKQYIYSFLTNESAETCEKFLKKYKSIHNRYPDLLPNKSFKKIDNMNDIYIDEETIYAMKTRCLINNVGLIGISRFEYTFIDSFFGQKNVFNLHISAVDLLENDDINQEQRIDHLNYLLDF